MNETDVKKLYDEREKRYIQAVNLEQPDRVPHETRFGEYWAINYAGYPIKGSTVNPKIMGEAMEKLAKDFATDTAPFLFSRNPLFYSSLKAQSFSEGKTGIMQHPEVCCMEPEEYDDLIKDPFKCIVDKILPRVFKSLDTSDGSGGMSLLQAMTIQNDMNTPILMESARVSQKYGLPSTGGGLLEAPMDYIADMIRGFSGMTKDVRRMPEKVAAAAEAVLPLMDKLAQGLPAIPGKLISIPLHMPVFMREKDFAKLWWPTFKTLVDKMAERGQYMRIYFEGDWTRYYDYLQDLPKKRILGVFEYMDHQLAKDKLGKTMCISGGYDVSLLQYGTKQAILDEAKKQMDILAPGGGYIFTVSKGITYPNDGTPENVKALYEFVETYGKY
ncbi:MAG: uroporphyrinogen decarboxylase family protein [Eubacterium sp.]